MSAHSISYLVSYYYIFASARTNAPMGLLPHFTCALTSAYI